jgi:hypothetical protein
MGKHDSTKTRVQPAFDAIGCSAENWNRFFRLFPCGARVPTIQEGGITEKEYDELGNYEKLDYFEKSLPHRDIKAQKRAKESYLGRISWDDLTEAFPKIHFSD